MWWMLPLMVAAAQVPPAFEVADVKANRSGEARMAVDLQPGGRLTMRNVPLKVMIVFAYHLRPEALDGPSWLGSERFDVVAKAAETASQDDVRRMMQTLLAEQFRLAVHTEQRLSPAFVLTVGKSGAKLQASDAALLSGRRCAPGQGAADQRHVECKHVTAAFLADYVQELAPRDFPAPVVDQTGLTGVYDFKLDWTPTTADGDGAGPTMVDAVRRLGLEIERKRMPLPVIVVDRVERVQ
jgi:uncharacterized protein (TIGR03435 family)